MSDTLADLIVRLRLDFSDSSPQLLAFAGNLESTSQQAADVSAALQGFGKTVEGMNAPLQAFTDIQDGAKLSAEQFVETLNKGIDEKFGSALSADSSEAQRLADEVKKANDALDEFFSTGRSGATTPVIPPEAVPEAMNLEQAFARLGVTSSQTLREQAEQAKTAYGAILASGTASIADLQKAWIGYEEARQKAAIASGEIISKTERDTLAQAKAPIEDLDHSANDLLSTLLKFAGITISIGALKEFAGDALQAYAEVEKATIAIGALTGSVGAAESAIAGLKQLALADALSFPSLVTAEQRMLAFGVDASKIPGTFRAIADAAAAGGRSFDAVANTFERIIESGAVQSRTLINLGINLKDLAAAMNVTESEAKKAFAALNQGERIDALEKALGKFGGTAEAVAQSLAGQWQNMQTQITLTLQNYGQAFAPVAEGFLGIGGAALKGANETATAFRLITDSAGHLGASLKTTAQDVAASHSEFSTLYNKAVEAAAGINKVDAGVAAANVSLELLAPAGALAANAFVSLYMAFDLINTKAPDVDKLIEGLHQHLTNLTHSATTSGDAFKKAWEQSAQVIEGVTKITDAQSKANLAVSNATREYALLSESLKAQKPLQDGHIATQLDVNRAFAGMKAAIDAADTSLLKHILTAGQLIEKESLLQAGVAKAQAAVTALTAAEASGQPVTEALAKAKDQLATAQKNAGIASDNYYLAIVKELEAQEQSIRKVNAAAVAYRDTAAQFGADSIQAQAALKLLNSALKTTGQAAVDAQGALDLFQPALVDTRVKIEMVTGGSTALGTSVEITTKKIADAGTPVQKVSADFGGLSAATGSAAGAFSGMTVQTSGVKTGLDAVIDAAQKASDTMKSSTGPAFDVVKGSAGLLQEKLEALTSSYQNQTKMADGHIATLHEVTKAQKDLNEALQHGKSSFDDMGTAGTKALNAIRDSGKSATQIITDFSQVVDGTGNIIASAMAEGEKAVTAFDLGIQKMKADWDAFTQSFNTPLPGPGTGSGGGKGLSKAGSTMANGDFNSGFSLPEHTHIDYSLWGISGARVVPDSGWYYDIYGNLVEEDWHAAMREGEAAHAPIGGAPSAPAAAPGPSTLIDTLSRNLATQNVQNLENAVQQLGETLGAGVITDVDGLTAALGSFRQTSTATTADLAAAAAGFGDTMKAAAASFQRLDTIMAPAVDSMPATLNLAKPGFMNTSPNRPDAFQAGGLVSANNSKSTVNNITVTDPNVNNIVQEFITRLQRLGIRF